MEIAHTHCAGLDVHKKTVVTTLVIPDGQAGVSKETRTFQTLSGDFVGLVGLAGKPGDYSRSDGKHWGILETSLQQPGE